MDLPLTIDELREVIIALQKDDKLLLADKLKLVCTLMEEGKPYKKILREEYNLVA